MKIFNAFLIILSLSQFVIGQEEEGTCSADGTCANDDAHDDVDDEDYDDYDDWCFPDGECFDSLEEAASYYQEQPTRLIELVDPVSYGEAQKVDSRNPEVYEKTLETLADTHHYMTDLFQNDTAKPFRDVCKLKHQDCVLWASTGECDKVSSLCLRVTEFNGSCLVCIDLEIFLPTDPFICTLSLF